MQYIPLGRTGLKVSRIALGTMNFGELADEAACFKIMDQGQIVTKSNITKRQTGQ